MEPFAHFDMPHLIPSSERVPSDSVFGWSAVSWRIATGCRTSGEFGTAGTPFLQLRAREAGKPVTVVTKEYGHTRIGIGKVRPSRPSERAAGTGSRLLSGEKRNLLLPRFMAGMFRPSSNSREIYFFHFPHNGGLRGVTYGTKNLVKSMIFDDFDTGENAENVGSRGLCFPPTSHRRVPTCQPPLPGILLEAGILTGR
jgi:hypothetical protein